MDNFRTLPQTQPEPIFAIAAKAKAAGPDALNGTIGILMKNDGSPLIFESTHSATDDVFSEHRDADYLYPPLLGLPEFQDLVTKLIFKENALKVASIAAAGGTGAVSVNLRLAKLMGIETALLPMPSWANHPRVIRGSGMQVKEIPYFDESNQASPDTLLETAQSLKKPHLILLQSGCHNPTGRDFSADQWQKIADALAKTPHAVLLDTAYQGLGMGLEEDVQPIRILCDAGVPLFVSWSASKNHSLYSFRTGLACAVVSDANTKEQVETHYGLINRTMYSVAPTMGQRILIRVQEKYREKWESEIDTARDMLKRKREILRENLPDDWKSLINGNGMFTQLPLSSNQVEKLQEQNVFLTLDGRVNISGIPSEKIPLLCEKIAEVV